MTNGILIVAHAPLASALRQCVLHVFPDCAALIQAVDVYPAEPPEASLAAAKLALAQLALTEVLVLTDLFGATPCNVAQKLVDGVSVRLLTGVNLPMLLRAATYRHEPLETLVTRAQSGGSNGIMQVAVTAPQNQTKKKNDQDEHQHQQ
jgi:mannose PTS system EIIA component